MIVLIALFLLLAALSWKYVTGIDKMYRDHPDYKGEDFLNEDI